MRDEIRVAFQANDQRCATGLRYCRIRQCVHRALVGVKSRMAGLDKLQVLLLDDQALVRAGMKALIELSEPRACVNEAASCEEALALLGSERVDVAFLDIALKGPRSGLDVLHHIRETGLSTRAIILSADAANATVVDCLRLGASGYIVKDMDGDGLFRQALDAVLRGEIFLPSEPGRAAQPPHDSATGSVKNSLEAMGVRGRAVEVLYYLCQGYSNQLIAHKMGVSERTIANDYNTRLFRQFRVTNRAALIVEVSRRGLAPPAPMRRDIDIGSPGRNSPAPQAYG
jgi:two-component system nitrate/nitrite response regulator NarL